ncbi:MAG TPA: hypothetical protein VLI93_10200 [Acetobacteraceae bacterium]|nr:hypothetical protein [Acetobacteraceae bacterium]
MAGNDACTSASAAPRLQPRQGNQIGLGDIRQQRRPHCTGIMHHGGDRVVDNRIGRGLNRCSLIGQIDHNGVQPGMWQGGGLAIE